MLEDKNKEQLGLGDNTPAADAPKETKEKKEFVNPFDAGISYETFLEAVGKKSIAEYCKGKLTEEQVEWLEKDIKLIKKQK